MKIKDVSDTLERIRALGLQPIAVDLHPDDFAEVETELLASNAYAVAVGASYEVDVDRGCTTLRMLSVLIYPRPHVERGRVSVRVASDEPREHAIKIGPGFASGSPRERQQYAEKLVAAALGKPEPDK